MKKSQRLVRALFSLSLVSLVNGCAAPLMVGLAVGAPEAAGHVVSGELKYTGADLRLIPWGNSYRKHLDNKLALERNDWVCAQAQGDEVCLPPEIVKTFKDKDFFHCRRGRGGAILTGLITRDSATYCEKSNEKYAVNEEQAARNRDYVQGLTPAQAAARAEQRAKQRQETQ